MQHIITLSQRIADLNELFGLRNAMYMRGERGAMFINDALLTLTTHIRKEVNDRKLLRAAAASLFARTCAFADKFYQSSNRGCPVPEVPGWVLCILQQRSL